MHHSEAKMNDRYAYGNEGLSFRNMNGSFASQQQHHHQQQAQQQLAAQQLQEQNEAELAYMAAASRGRLHRFYARLNSIEWSCVQILQMVGAWPSLLQPPQTEALLRHMEGEQPLPSSTDDSSSTNSSSPVAPASPRTSNTRLQWNASLLRSSINYIFPNAWHPLSFRKTVLIEPSLEPQRIQSSSNAQVHWMFLLLFVVLLLNTLLR